MKKLIDNQWFRGLRASLAVALTVAVADGCFTIPGVIEPARPCTCDCVCNDGRTFCESRSLEAGTVECSNGCWFSGTEDIVCKDKTRDDVVLPPFDATAPGGQCTEDPPVNQLGFLFCETCTDSPAMERDFPIWACSFESAEEKAQDIADFDGGEEMDCSISLGRCGAE